MLNFKEKYYRPTTDDVRFTAPALWAALGLEGNGHGRKDIQHAIVAAGGLGPIKGRVNGPHGQVTKDALYYVPSAKWAGFWQAMQDFPTPKEKRPSAETQLDRIERMLTSICTRLVV